MKTILKRYITLFFYVTFVFFAAMAHNGSVYAGDYSQQNNLNSMANLMSKWSKQLSSGKVEPMAQEKMGEMMGRMSEVLKEMAGTGGSGMSMDHHNKIEAMKKDWDPFDTADRM